MTPTRDGVIQPIQMHTLLCTRCFLLNYNSECLVFPIHYILMTSALSFGATVEVLCCLFSCHDARYLLRDNVATQAAKRDWEERPKCWSNHSCSYTLTIETLKQRASGRRTLPLEIALARNLWMAFLQKPYPAGKRGLRMSQRRWEFQH